MSIINIIIYITILLVIVTARGRAPQPVVDEEVGDALAVRDPLERGLAGVLAGLIGLIV